VSTTTPDEPFVGVVVLAGGTSARLGGGDKTALNVGGMPILVRLLAGLTPVPTVVVARPPTDPLPGELAHVMWTREDPPGGGPAAGLAAGVAALPAAVDVVVVLAGDQPFAAGAVPRLLDALRRDPGVDGVLGIDADGRAQPLLAAYRAAGLARVLPQVRSGDSLRSALAAISRSYLQLVSEECLDVDNSDDLALAREIVRGRVVGPTATQSS
jgi:molybdopterin-guanine dinucleotide biosynthesis protein A